MVLPYTPPTLLFNAHLQTIYPSLLRKVVLQAPVKERIETPDDDFLDLDWYRNGSPRLVIISHGLEGNSTRAYVTGMARAFLANGFDVLAWNYRGCSEEMNRQLRFYHGGATDDLSVVIDHAARQYQDISLIGFSMGGNITLKYLGERGSAVIKQIRKAVAISVPIDLHMSCLKISEPGNWMYSSRFLRNLKKKVKAKARVRQGIDVTGIDKLKTLKDFDDRYTAPLHGFSDAIEYYQASSSLRVIDKITVPTLIVNAKNDPFLSQSCYPEALLKSHPAVTFEAPEQGGHVGFALFNRNGLYWSELRALEFIQS